MSTFILAGVLTVIVLGFGVAVREHLGDALPERDLLRRRSSGLSVQERLGVRRAVQKGRVVRDPALAATAVARARYVRAYTRRFTGGRWRWGAAVIGGGQFLVAGQRLVDPTRHGLPRWVGVGGSALLGLLLVSSPWQHGFYGRRAARAEQRLAVLYEQQQGG